MLVSVRDGDAGVSALFRLPNGTTQLLANVASVLDAVGCGDGACIGGCGCVCGSAPGIKVPDPEPKGDARATRYDDVRRRFISNCDIPSESDSDGDGGPEDIGTAENVGSVSAVVAIAFAAAGELVTVASVGGRAEDILDVVDNRDAREPGRNGEDVRGCGGLRPANGVTTGGDESGTLGESNGEDGGSCGCSEEEGSGSEVGGGVGASASDGGTTTDDGSSYDSGDAWASNRESEEGPAEGVELARARVGNKCEVGGCVTLNEFSTWA